MGSKRLISVGGLAAAAVACLIAGAASGAQPPTPEPGGITPLSSDVQHLHFKYGPIHVAPGQNLILVGPVTIEKPAYDGYVTRIKPNLVRADGSVPPVDVIHLHHGVFLNMSRQDSTTGATGERFFATGEEKTIFRMPPGYGYFVRGSDVWAMNYMVHNQTPVADNVWITYDVDYVPANTPLGRTLKPARPIWMDVENGSAYPVFDVHHGAGGRKGRWTFPDDAHNPYGSGKPKNVWKATRDGTLIAAVGHVHPGGLWDDLTLEHGTGSATKRAHIFRSEAKYYDPNGPISWDMSMKGTKPNWRVPIHKGDRLKVSATYDTRRASWYESMGIVVAYMADGAHGPDPFRHPPPLLGTVTHGPLPENSNHGGANTGAVDPRSLPDGHTVDDRVGVEGFQYTPGGAGLPSVFGRPPTVKRGQTLTFDNQDWAADVYHTITACRAPCNRSTGISYPLANGPIDFDSGELGYGLTGLTAAKNSVEWKTPANLPAGTYTYFCRVHPYMRGAFRVTK